MQCIIKRGPVNGPIDNLKLFGEIEEKDIINLDSMCEEGISAENQTFYVEVHAADKNFECRNYSLQIDMLQEYNRELYPIRYEAKNVMTKVLPRNKVEFIVVPDTLVKRIELDDDDE